MARLPPGSLSVADCEELVYSWPALALDGGW